MTGQVAVGGSQAVGRGGLWAAIGIVLITLNLRPAVVALSPILDLVSVDLELDGVTAGLLLTLPVLCFGVFGLATPAIGRALGMERSLALVLVAIIVGSLLRLHPSTGALFAGTAFIGAGIAVGNVMLPGIIKRDFPHRLGLMSGLFTMAITGGASLAAGITVPIAEAAGLHWTATLAVWGILAVLALVAWVPQLVRPAAVALHSGARIRIGHDRVAWYVTAYMGLQSFYFYAMASWLPTILIAWGHEPFYAGVQLSVFNLTSIIPALAVPLIVERMRSQVGFSAGLMTLYVVATAGFLWAPSIIEVWVVLGGIAQGAALGLALTLIVLRSPDSDHATALSGMAQGYGYLVAAAGPLLFGVLNQSTGGWTASLVLLFIIIGVQAVSGHLAGKPRLVTSRPATVVEHAPTKETP